MKKIGLKVVSLALIASISLIAVGCAKKNDSMTSTEGKLIMATNAQFPPYEYHDGDSIVGIDAEIAQAIADKLNLELVIEDVNFDSIITGVTSGKYDIGMAGMTVTPERQESVNFSTTYATGIQSIIVPEDSEITDIDTLRAGDYVVGVQEATTGDIYMTDDIGDERIYRYTTGADEIQALVSGKIDAVVIDNQPALSYVAANDGLTILDTPYAEEDYAICINKDNEELLNAINGALEELQSDGTIDAIISKYIVE